MEIILTAQRIINLQASRVPLTKPSQYPALSAMIQSGDYELLECQIDNIPIPLDRFLLVQEAENGNYKVIQSSNYLYTLEYYAEHSGLVTR